MAIAGLESGYGSGYIAQITGNILSLGANKNDIQLKALILPYCEDDKNKNILYDLEEQKLCKNLIWKKRDKSLKKDYRPSHIAGTSTNLAYFKYHPKEYQKAKLKSINDFLTIWINKNHKYSPFKEAKIWLNEKVKQEGIDSLFSLKTNQEFALKISGKKNSFNYRKSWSKKVNYILKNTGLNELCKSIYYDNYSFKKAWTSRN